MCLSEKKVFVTYLATSCGLCWENLGKEKFLSNFYTLLEQVWRRQSSIVLTIIFAESIVKRKAC